MNILRNAQQVSQSHLVAHRELYTVPFPDTNHPDLELDYSETPTKASSVLDTLTVDPESYKVPAYRQQFMKVYNEIKTSWQFNATRAAPITEKEWEDYDTRLRALIIDHVNSSLSKKNLLDKNTKQLLDGGVNTTDSLSSTPESKMKDSLASMITPHIRDHFFICEDYRVEQEALQDLTWRSLGLATVPTPPRSDRNASGDYVKYTRALKANTQAMVKLRELINHCYIWFLYTVSTHEVQREFKQVHQEFIHAKIRESSDAKFTAQAIVNYVIANYLTENDAQIKLLERQIEKMIRYENEPILDWLNRFQTPITKLEVARGARITDDAELKQLWKDIFANNISSVEHTIIARDMASLRLDPKASFTEEDQSSVERYRFGVFEETTLRRMLVLLKFPLYKPDKGVREYNTTRFTKLALGEPSYVNPDSAPQHRKRTPGLSRSGEERPANKPKRDATRNLRPRRGPRTFLSTEYPEKDACADDQEEDIRMGSFLSSGTSGLRDSSARRAKRLTPRTVLPSDQWCTNSGCIQRETHKYHTTQTCKFPSTSAKRTPQKPGFHTSSRPASSLFPQRKDRDRKRFPKRDSKEIGPCWNCHEMGHLQKDCPRVNKAAHYLKSCEESATLLTDLFETKEEEDAAWRVLANIDRLCHNCLRAPAECSCAHETEAFLATASSVRNKIASEPKLLRMFHDAYDHVDSSGSSGISPATATAFLTNPEGQDGTDATVEAEDEYRHTTDTSGMAGGIERESADVSLDTDAFNSQESDHMVDEEYAQEMEEPLDQFFTRYEEDTLMPCRNVGIETNSNLYHELHRVSEGKPLWQQNATALKSAVGGRGRIAVGEATVRVPLKDGQSTWQTRKVYLDSCGSFPLIQEEELHDVKDASEYGLPPLRFSTLESKTGWYNKVGIMHLRLDG